MDKPTITSQIPINTRIIGTPGGVYVLYLEDYVHTFIKKLISENMKKNNSYKTTGEITLYGNRFDEDGTSILVVSGAVSIDFMADKADKYFADCILIGIAKASINKDGGIRIEIAINSEIKVILDDFYIYYDQNEQMQNYLIEWNLKHQTSFPQLTNFEEVYQDNIASEDDETVRYGHISHTYSKEEPKVSFMWNAMNVLSLGFVICVTVYGIVSINNYQKMQGMEKNIDYCISIISENMFPKDNNTQIAESETAKTIEVMQQNIDNENQAEVELSVSNDLKETSQEEAAMVNEALSKEDVMTQTIQNTDSQTTQPNATETKADLQPQVSTPQYYVVRKGDTLRTICFDVYGDYSRVYEVCKWNNIENPDSILYGQKLLLP